jgi:hypothetical protein
MLDAQRGALAAPLQGLAVADAASAAVVSSDVAPAAIRASGAISLLRRDRSRALDAAGRRARRRLEG